jgi:hypothetical protein
VEAATDSYKRAKEGVEFWERAVKKATAAGKVAAVDLKMLKHWQDKATASSKDLTKAQAELEQIASALGIDLKKLAEEAET